MLVAVLDACVLYPIRVCSVLLWSAQADLVAVRWTEEILEEARRNVLADRPDLDPDDIKGRFALMCEQFPEAMVDGYQHRVPEMTNHPKDRHVLAAAVESDADLVVTANIRDFAPKACEPLGIGIVQPDQLLRDLAHDDEASVLEVFRDIARSHRRPPDTLDAVLESHRRQFPLTVGVFRPEVNDHLINIALPGRGNPYQGH